MYLIIEWTLATCSTYGGDARQRTAKHKSSISDMASTTSVGTSLIAIGGVSLNVLRHFSMIMTIFGFNAFGSRRRLKRLLHPKLENRVATRSCSWSLKLQLLHCYAAKHICHCWRLLISFLRFWCVSILSVSMPCHNCYIVLPAAVGTGLQKLNIRDIVSHPQLSHSTTMTLYTLCSMGPMGPMGPEASKKPKPADLLQLYSTY